MSKQILFNRSVTSFIENLHYRIDNSTRYPSCSKVPFDLQEKKSKIVGNCYEEAYKLIVSDLIKKFREEK